MLARTIKGKGVPEIEDKDGWHGKALPAGHGRAGHRRAGRAQRPARHHAAPEPRRTRPSRPTRPRRSRCPATSWATRSRPARRYGDALPRSAARPEVVALDGEVEQLHPRRRVPEGLPGPLLRDVHRRAAAGRHRGRARGARLHPVRLHLRRVLLPRLRLHPDGRHLAGRTSGWSARTPASRSARTARRRWRSRTWPRCARSTARPCSTRPTPPAPPSLVATMADTAGIVYLRTTRGAYPVLYPPGETFQVGGSKVLPRRAPTTRSP